MGEPGRDVRCYVHIGTHKTGTTAIQRLLNRSPARLASQGVLYPRSAVYIDGHHNLVFELMGDSRFDASAGTWSDLSDEIAASGAHSVCLSSEAFEYLHDRPDDLALMRERLERLGLTPVIVLYVRPQAQYAESLFAEVAKHGHTGSFDRFLDEVCSAGTFRAREYGCTETFAFDYDAIASGFANVFGAEHLVVRRYPAEPGAVVDDFLRLIGVSARETVPDGAQRIAVNRRQPLLNVARSFVDNIDRPGDAGGKAHELLDYLREHETVLAGVPFRPVEPRHLVKLAARFTLENVRLALRWGLSLPVWCATDVLASFAAALDQRPEAEIARTVLQSLSDVLT